MNFFFLTESFSFSEVPFLFFKRLFKITFPFGPHFVDAGPSITLRISVGESFLSVSPSLCVCVCPSLCLSALSLFPPNFFPLFEPLQLRGLPQSLVIPACLLIVGGRASGADWPPCTCGGCWSPVWVSWWPVRHGRCAASPGASSLLTLGLLPGREAAGFLCSGS